MNKVEDRISSLEKSLETIKTRNNKVELEKSWEVSGFRVLLLVSLTYFVAVVFMIIAKIDRPFLNSLIPTGGYFISIQGLTFVKEWWINKRNKK